MKRNKISSKISNKIFIYAPRIIPLFFLFFSCVSYMLSLPDGNTKLKSLLWAVGIILSLVLYILRNDIPKNYKYFPFAFYIFMNMCSLPLGRSLVNTDVLFVKPVITSCIIEVLIILESHEKTRLLMHLRIYLVIVLYQLFLFDALSLGKINYLLGNSSESVFGYINKLYTEIFFISFGSSLNIPWENGVYLNKKQFIKLINTVIICGISVTAILALIMHITNTSILFREFYAVIILYWCISSFFSYFVMIRFAKKRFPGDRIYRKLFYDSNDLILSKKHFEEYKNVVHQIDLLEEELKSSSEENRIALENELSELLEYEQFLKQ